MVSFDFIGIAIGIAIGIGRGLKTSISIPIPISIWIFLIEKSPAQPTFLLLLQQGEWKRPLARRFRGPYTGRMDEQQTPTLGTIEVDLFSRDVDDPEHPEAARFHRLLEEVAADYGCELVSFSVKRGTVAFAFDDDVLTADILRELEMDYGEGEGEPPA